MKNQICTILGGGGFIGRYLVRNLTKKNYRCIISTRKPFQKGYLKTQSTPGAVELLEWNLNNLTVLKEAIKKLRCSNQFNWHSLRNKKTKVLQNSLKHSRSNFKNLFRF